MKICKNLQKELLDRKGWKYSFWNIKGVYEKRVGRYSFYLHVYDNGGRGRNSYFLYFSKRNFLSLFSSEKIKLNGQKSFTETLGETLEKYRQETRRKESREKEKEIQSKISEMLKELC